MSDWLSDHAPGRGAPADRRQVGADAALRALDIGVALLALIPLALPMLAAACVGRMRLATNTADGVPQSHRHEFVFADGPVGRVFAAFGARTWPALLDVLAGRLAWVGPRSLVALPAWVTQAGVRPGVVGLWDLRRRTAVDFVSELDCDYEYLARRGLRHDAGLLLRAVLMRPLQPSGSQVAEDRVRICDVEFDNVSMAEALDRLSEMLDGSTTQQVSFVNPACVNIAAADRGYRRALARAALVLPDGIGTKIGADILGTPLKQNVNGTDLFPRLCDLLEQRGARLFLLGGQPGVPQAVAARIGQQWPGVQVVGCRDGFFSAAEEGEVVAQVRESGADILLIARGVPMQDIFIDRYLSMFGTRVVMGVGGLFDFVAGRINRAPSWMRDSGLEWVYRLLQEPGRMWQRYLVGNFTFLARVTLQRLGLRTTASDAVRGPAPCASALPGPGAVRGVLFACDGSAAELPMAADHPAALLPLGCSSFVERAMEHFAEAGVRHVDLVVSHQPETLRRLIGAGERWGLTVRWHLARQADTPYDMLRDGDWGDASHLVIGHADRWVGREAVQALVSGCAVADETSAAAASWTGWAGLTVSALRSLPANADFATLAQATHGAGLPLLLLQAGSVARADSPHALLQAQIIVADSARAIQVPGSWIRMPWGAMSPSARVHHAARLIGPVLLGPGCFVDGGTEIGPHVVLTRDVAVGAGSVVRAAVVMPDTYIGKGLDVDGAIVSGNRIHQIGLGVTLSLPAGDGLLMSLRRRPRSGPGVASRTAALAAAGLLAPWALADHLLRACQGAGPRWQRRSIASAAEMPGDKPESVSLREPRQRRSAGPAHPLDTFGPLLDVVQGRRCWLGVRPRDADEWSALSTDWRALLEGAAPGVFHAPAWSTADNGDDEAAAAADAFLVVQTDRSKHLALLRSAIRTAWFVPDHAAKTVKPPPAWAPPGA